MSDSLKIGAAGELVVAAELLARGWEVHRNLAQSGADLVAWKSGVFLRIDVTTNAASKSEKLRKWPGIVVAILEGMEEVQYWVLEEGRPKRMEL